MTFVLNCMIGIAIGIGAILPGISSGVICIIFGIYEKLLDTLLNFFKSPKKNLKFLLPIVFGIFIGVFIFSKILNCFLINFPIQTKSIFVGLILSSIPALLKEINSNHKFKFNYIIYFLISFIIGIISVFIENTISTSIGIENSSYIYLILSGFMMSAGIVIPGVSSTVILMLIGIYPTYLYSISTLYIPVIIPMGIGLAIGCFCFMKITNFLFKNFYPQTLYAIIGFTIGSILVLFPSIRFDLSGFISILCILIGILFFNLIKKVNM